MKSFLQFLYEDVVDFYHKTHPDIAQRLQSGEKIYPSGLSVFLDPDIAKNYTAQTSGGHVPGNAVTVTGKVPTSKIIPDLEWHPEAYNELLGKVNPDRPPTLHVNRPSGSGEQFRYTIPGIRTEIDPQSGTKKIIPNWSVIKDPAGKPVLQVGKSIMDFKNIQTITPDTGKISFGGSATTGGKYGFRETPWLDVLGRKSDVTKLTRDFMKTGSPNETGFKAFRTMGASGVKVDVPPKPPATPKSSITPKPSVIPISSTPKLKLPTLGQVADVLDISSPGAVAIGAVVDLAKANWDAIKNTPVWAAEKMGQKVETPDAALLGQLQDDKQARTNSSSRYRK